MKKILTCRQPSCVHCWIWKQSLPFDLWFCPSDIGTRDSTVCKRERRMFWAHVSTYRFINGKTTCLLKYI